MTITDGAVEGGDGAVHWTSDPCPAVHNYANYSSTCGDTPPAHQAVICTSDTVDKWFSSNPGFARIRTPDKSGPGCPCGPNRYSMVILEEPIDTSSVALRVNPPWGLWIGPISDFIDGGVANPFCNTPSLTQCYEGPLGHDTEGTLRGLYLILGTSADPPPARNVTVEPGGHCP